MLYYKINYYHNRFFILNNEYYIYVFIKNNEYIYDFELKKNGNLFMYIKNKKNNIYEDEHIKIINYNKEANIIIKNNLLGHIKICNIKELVFDNTFILNNNCPYFNIDYYIQNNNLLNNNFINNIEYINYHWLLSGRLHPHLYFKFLLKKYENIIFNITIPNITINPTNNNTLLFIDDRYDMSFIYLLKLFCYSVNENWNITIFTTENNKNKFENDLNKIGVSGKIFILDKSFQNKDDYSNLLKSPLFWSKIKEDNCILFQYDSFCMNKFNPIFFNYNYIGARWPHKATIYNNVYIGNGGTSFRKTRIMEQLSLKFNEQNLKRKKLAEDIYFAELLYESNLLNCTSDIADLFSFENIFNENSIYAHQIYNTISLEKLDSFIKEKLTNLL
jgi:hypothetical protein